MQDRLHARNRDAECVEWIMSEALGWPLSPALDEGDKKRSNGGRPKAVNGPNAEGTTISNLHLGFANRGRMCLTSLPLRKC